MAKTLAQAQANWERKTANAGERWKTGVSGAGGRYGKGFSDFIGAQVSPRVVSNWEQGTGAVTAAEFQSDVAGKGGKWAENLRRSVTS